MPISLAGRDVGEGCPIFVTFEAGPTHDGVDSAKALTRAAADAGADAIKFQIIDADRLVADPEIEISYGVLKERGSDATRTKKEPLLDILRRRMLSREEWRAVKAEADAAGIAFFATVGFEEEVDFVSEIGAHSIKIASADINHHPLIEYAAKTGLCMQLDTGHATIGEVEAAVDIIRRCGNESIVIHHCPTGYPARLEGINLHIIPTLRRMFEYPIAFSDHTPGWEMDIAAIALGANLIEKTLTEDRMTDSVEHVMSLEPDEAKDFVRAIRELEAAIGRNRRILDEDERQKRLANRRSLYSSRDLAEGAVLGDEDVDYRRPGYGIPVVDGKAYIGRRLVRSVKAGQALSPEDFA